MIGLLLLAASSAQAQTPLITAPAAYNMQPGTVPIGVATGVFNPSGGLLDFAVLEEVPSTTSYQVEIFHGQANGSFCANCSNANPNPDLIALPPTVIGNAIAVGQFVSGAAPEIAVATNVGISFLLNNSSGTFTLSSNPILVYGGFHALTVGQFDATGNYGIAAVTPAISGTVSFTVYFGDGNGNFTASYANPVNSMYSQCPTIMQGNFQGQTTGADVVLSCRSVSEIASVFVYLNLGTGNSTGDDFASPPVTVFSEGSTSTGRPIAVGTLNGEGTIFVSPNGGVLEAFESNGQAGASNEFTQANLIPVGLSPEGAVTLLYDPLTGSVDFANIGNSNTLDLYTFTSYMQSGTSVDGTWTSTADLGPSGILATGFSPNLTQGAAYVVVDAATHSNSYYDANVEGPPNFESYLDERSVSVSLVTLNGDGTVAGTNAAPVYSPTFSEGYNFPPNFATGDFEGRGNGIQDLAVGGANDASGAATVSIYLANSDKSLPSNTSTPTSVITANTMYSGTDALVAGQFRTLQNTNGKALSDLAVFSSNTIFIFTSNGDGTFNSGSSYSLSGDPNYPGFEYNPGDPISETGQPFAPALRAVDVNGDGIPDLVLMLPEDPRNCNGSGSVSQGAVYILISNGDGTFQPPVFVPPPVVNPVAVTAAEFFGSSVSDLAFANGGEYCAGNTATTTGAAVGILQNQIPAGTTTITSSDFNAVTVVPQTSDQGIPDVSGIASADMNHDGLPDLVVSGTNGIQVLLNQGVSQGSISFAAQGTVGLYAGDVVPGAGCSGSNYVGCIDYDAQVATGSFFVSGENDVAAATNGIVYFFQNQSGTGTLSAPTQGFVAGADNEYAPYSMISGALTGPNGLNSLLVATPQGAADLVNTGSSSPGGGVQLTALSLLVTPSGSVDYGQPVTLTATVTTANGSPVTAGTVNFYDGSTLLQANVILNSSGQASYMTSSLTSGQHSFTADYNGSSNYASSMALKPSNLMVNPLESIAVTPMNPSIAVSGTQQFIATGTYSDNSTQNITTSVTWSSSDTSVATISNSSGTQGLATGVMAGPPTANITATQGNISGSTSLTVTSSGSGPTLTSISVTPANPSITAGNTQQFAATGHYSDGSMQTITNSVTWGSSNNGIAIISNTGLATGLQAGGPINITAMLDGVTGSTMLTVGASLPPVNVTDDETITVTDTPILPVSDDETIHVTDTPKLAAGTPIVISPSAASFNASSGAGFVSQQYSGATFSASGGLGLVHFGESGTLPSGMSFVDNDNGTATLSGTPSAAGTFPFSITGTDAINDTITQSGYTLVISAQAIAIYSSPVNFGSVMTGSTVTQELQVMNTGGSAFTIESAAFSGSGAPFSLLGTVSNCNGYTMLPATLGPNQSCNIDLQIAPTATTGETSADLIVVDTAGSINSYPTGSPVMGMPGEFQRYVALEAYVATAIGHGQLTTIAGSTAQPPSTPVPCVPVIKPLQLCNQGYSGDGGPATSAELHYPDAVAAGGDGTVYVADELNSAIRAISPVDGTISTYATLSGTGVVPTAIAVNNGTVTYSDSFGNIYTGPGAQTGNTGSNTSVEALATDGNGNLYKLLTVEGAFEQIWGPNGIIADTTNISGPLGGASLFGLAVDSSGNVYTYSGVSGSYRNEIIEISNGSITAISPSGLIQGGVIGSSMAMDSMGNFYVLSQTGMVQEFAPSTGALTLYAGTGTLGYNNYYYPGGGSAAYNFDGPFPATQTDLNGPVGLAVDQNGNVYVADTTNNLVRKIINQPITPIIVWPSPAPIAYGTDLGPTQLDATAVPIAGGPSISGTFMYNPAAGATLPLGQNQTLSVTFYPTDSLDFTSPVMGMTTITVDEASATQLMASPPSAQTALPVGTSVTLTATVSAAQGDPGNPGTPTGTVTFYNGGTSLGTASLTAGIATLPPLTNLPQGSNSITASYSGDSVFAPSTSSAVTVNIGTPVAEYMQGAIVNLTGPTQPVVVGSSQLGTIQYIGVDLSDTGQQTLTINGASANSFNAVTPPAFNAFFSSCIGPNGVYTTQNPVPLPVSVPNDGFSFCVLTVQFTATDADVMGSLPCPSSLTSNYAHMACDTVQVTDNAPSSNVATQPSSQNLYTQTITVGAAYVYPSIIQLNTSAPAPGTVVQGTPVVLTAQVSSNDSSFTTTPTGTVTFQFGSTTLGTATLSKGVATLTVSSSSSSYPLPVGTDAITAAYSGDTNYASSNSTPQDVVVTAGTPDYTVSASTNSVTVAAGSSSPPITITVTPVNGYSGTVTFSCGGLPSYVTCIFTPASGSVTLNGTTMQTVTLVVMVSATVMLEHHGLVFFALIMPLGLLCSLPMIGRNRKRLRLYLMIAALTIGLGGALAGCGSSTSSGSSSTLPPAGTQSFTVTASGASSSGSATQQLQLTITITN